ncbi:bifunctional diguanylate cyclase/phosphodiesterase [Kineosporia rhizophila]|uniref:putative bifunctional diguanylate cyclase/phosphodiesterase n=1 Tax=Kineosporia TaxID=49184 RepID=UPI001E5B3D46|nr:bifunctional diguanylate cyclase/phosphodiesterase [Kineosporia sp. NBRC 101677]MCE0537047.1 bifunctional diguanylate cyclase/phosphodiesterase [Kineosporia rhizophila]
MTPASGRASGDIALRAAAVFAVACVVALTLAGPGHGPQARELATGLTGAVALACGAVLAWRGTTDGPARYRQVLGASLVFWGIGQVVNGLTDQVFPAAGDGIALVAAPLAVWGLLLVPRRTPGRRAAWRLGLDSVLLGVTVALPVWHFAFARALSDRPLEADVVMAVLVLIADLTVICFAVLAYVRDLDRNLLLAAVGAGLYVVGDLVSLRAALTIGETWPWWAALLWCLAWPVIAYGLLNHQAGPADDRSAPVDPEARGVVVTTTASLVLLMVSLAALLVADDTDKVALVLVMIAVIVFGGRELLNTRIRAALLQRLNEEATADPLTGLANRRVLQAQMARLQHGEPWCLLTVDLDGFKDVNDLLGHATGDKLLAAVAHRLAAAVPPGALVSRIGGDEFAVLLPGSLEIGTQVGQTVVTAVRQSAADVDGVNRVEVSASIGVAAVDARATLADLDSRSAPEDDFARPTVVDPLGALSASGAALRVAKATGRNRVEVYDATVAQIRQRRLRVEERLRTAVEDGAITVQFQPIVDLRRGVVTGAEALARWTDPQLGRVGPDEFITVAEQTGLVVDIGEQILEATLSSAVKEGLFDRGLRINCNVSPVQLRVPGFHQVVQEALTAHGAPREQFVIEVTEQVLVEEGQAAQTLHRLAALGLTIAIDDFGTGYSALGYLQRLPADILKIDRALTSSLVSEPRSRAITRAVLDLSRTVGVSVVVEGVETSQVDDLVRRMGVGFGQGLHYGHAMSAGDLAAMADRLGRSGP